MPNRNVLYLIDGHALAYRTYFALTAAGGDSGRWMTKSGEPTAGTYGFTSVLLNLLQKDRPDYLAVSFDAGRTFRDDLYAEYKGTRAKMPDELSVQIERIQEVVAAFGIPVLTAEGYEADDVLGTIARRAAAQGVSVKIITGDRDLLQLADERITINLAGQKLSEAVDYGPAEVQARFGLTPAQYIHFKALVGDASDNIPGVKGIGEKTATTLLQTYGSLDGIYANLDSLAKGVRAKLEAGKESAYLSLKLATIVTDLDLPFDLEACRVRPPDRARIFELFRELEFNSLLKRLPEKEEERGKEEGEAIGHRQAAVGNQMGLFAEAAAPAPAREGPTRTHIVTDEAALAALLREIEAATDGVAFDVETDGLSPMRAGLVGIALAVKEGEGYYIPVGHTEGQQLPPARVLEALKGPLTHPKIPKHGHNINFDYIALARHGVRVTPLGMDTLLGEWLCDPASHSLNLKKLALVRLGVEMTEISELIGKGRKQVTMAQVPIEQAAVYAAADADIVLRLIPVLRRELEEKRQLDLLNKLEMPLIPVLAEMEMTGIRLDTKLLAAFSKELEQQLAQLEQEVYAAAGVTFNLNSPQQLSDVLFGKLALKPPDRSRKTASGKYSTAADVLEEMRGQHPVIDLILEQRELAKLKSTYVDALPQQVNPATGRVHTSFNQAGAVTGRLASTDPNLQNIPVRTELGRRVRRAFIAAPGHVLLSADYSQIELRIAAHYSQDPALMRTFFEGGDIHTATAAAVLGLPPEKIDKNQRRIAKTVNFGILYGQSAFGLTRTTGLTLAEAENFIKNYFDRFPGLKRYLDETKRMAVERGYVETLLGRRRYFPGLSAGAASANTREAAIARARAEREAINAPIQGTAADIVKKAMLELPPALAAAGLSAKLLLQVHDELLLECPVSEVQATARVARRVMESAFPLRVPLAVEVRAGPNWEDMEVVEE
ncbi:MAG: DNA polymerase I [Anaerolineales bacterium]|nr:DNA polymerase I [Anaerolineales bacterium]